jgi:hypothetical protein
MIFAATATATASDPITMSAPFIAHRPPSISKRHRLKMPSDAFRLSRFSGGRGTDQRPTSPLQRIDEGGRPIRSAVAAALSRPTIMITAPATKSGPPGFDHLVSVIAGHPLLMCTPYWIVIASMARLRGSKVPPKRGPPPGLLCPPAFRPRRDFAPIPRHPIGRVPRPTAARRARRCVLLAKGPRSVGQQTWLEVSAVR